MKTRLSRALAAAILSCLLALASRAVSEEKTVLVYRLELPRKRFIAGETILVKLLLENRSAAPVSVPDPEVNSNSQPVYTLTSPAAPGGERFTLGERVGGGRRPVPAAPVLREIAPGATWEGHLPLSEVAAVGSAGDYRLRSRLEWQGGAVDSDELAFSVDPLLLADVGFGTSATPDGLGEVFACGLARSGDGHAVLLLRFAAAGHPGEPLAAESVATIATAPASARDPSAPEARHLRIPDFFNWSVWREGGELLALTSWGGAPCRFELAPDALLLRPALMARTHELDAFALKGPWLFRVRFDDPDRAPERRGHVLDAHDLLFAPATGTCALEAEGARRHVALAGRSGEKLLLVHAVYKGDERPRFARLELEGLDLLADAPPALAVSARGTRVLLVAVASEGEEPRPVVVVEATFPADPSVAPSTTRRSVSLGRRVEAARVGYSPLGTRQDAFARTDDGKLHDLGGRPRVVREKLDAQVPLRVVVLETATYLLEKDARRGLVLTGLP